MVYIYIYHLQDINSLLPEWPQNQRKKNKNKNTRHPKTKSSPKNQAQSFIAIEGESIFHANITPRETHTMSAMAMATKSIIPLQSLEVFVLAGELWDYDVQGGRCYLIRKKNQHHMNNSKKDIGLLMYRTGMRSYKWFSFTSPSLFSNFSWYYIYT